MESILSRIRQIAENENITVTSFEKKIGASKGVLSRAMSNNTDIQTKWIEKIVENYPQYNPEWLLTGKGEMLKKEYDVQMIHNPSYREPLSDEEINLYDIDAAANLQTLFENRQQNIIGKIKIPDLPRCDGAIYIRGDSMYPLLKSGDIVVFKEIHSFSSVIYGEMYLIDFSIDGDDYLVVKYVNRSDVEGCIQLTSYNPHHQPMDIPVSSIRSMAIIKASIRLNTMI